MRFFPRTIIAIGVLVAVMVVGVIATMVRFPVRDADRRGAEEASAEPTVSAVVSRRHGPVAVRGTMEERVAACTSCHSAATEATPDGFSPRIAGKPAGYLFNQLLAFRDGRRTYPPMVYLVQNLSEAYLREMAAYFGELELPYPPPERTALSNEESARARDVVEHGDPARGVPACIECHGRNLAGIEPGIPGILGLPRQYMNAQFGAWRSGRLRSRASDCMAEVASRLAQADAALVAAWLAAQPVSIDMKRESAPRKLPLDCAATAAAKPEIAPPEPPLRSRGEDLVAAGDCIACHTALGGAAFAGGRAIATPFGTVYSSNITPDPATGIGRWSRDDFWRALHEGRSKDGRLLYPAFPYPNFTRITREDADAMFDYLRSLAPVSRPNTAHALRFPYGTQVALAAWRAFFFRPGIFQPDPDRSAEWNRGAYLVRGPGHCDACHAPRNIFGAVSHSLNLGGGLIPTQNWYAPPLGSAARGEARRHPDDIVSLLKSGVSRAGTAMGPMAEVVYRSTQHMPLADLRAIAAYLQSIDPGLPRGQEAPATDTATMERGATVYAEHCAKCHGDDGEGAFPAYPPLAHNRSLGNPVPANAIKAVLYGGYAPTTFANPRPYGMPPYAGKLTEHDIAAVLTYVRSSWGNAGAPVTAIDIERYR